MFIKGLICWLSKCSKKHNAIIGSIHRKWMVTPSSQHSIVMDPMTAVVCTPWGDACFFHVLSHYMQYELNPWEGE